MRRTIWKLTRRRDRAFWVVRYKLAGSHRWREATTKKTRKRDAEAAARQIITQAEIDGDRETHGWAEFRHRYETEHLSGRAPKTLQAFQTAANRLQELCGVEWISELDADRFSRFADLLRREGKSEATIAAYRAHLLASLKWAKQVKLIDQIPEPPPLARVPSGTKSRGRSLTREEAERIAMQLPSVVGPEFASRWAWNLEGLWRSGFRIGETLLLVWDFRPGCHWIDGLDDYRPRMVIDATGEKGFQNRTLPLTPDFVAMLREVPKRRRVGSVFRWPLSRGETVCVKTIGKRISECGRAAGVVTGNRSETVKQFATAHDFRRAFGARWAPKVMPIVLKEMMRHSSIETTLKYYVGANAERTAEAMWDAQNAVLGDMLDSFFSSDIQLPELADRQGLEP